MSSLERYPWLRRMLDEHPAVLVSMLYFAASAIGLFYSWTFLHAFGINIFPYAEASDFLLASLKEPFTWVLTLFAAVMIYLDNAMSRRVQARNPGWILRWYGSERYRRVNYLVLTLLVMSLLFAYANLKERRIRDGNGEVVGVYLSDGSAPKQLVLLATTVRFVFLFDHVGGRVNIHPHESILMITKASPDPKK